MAEAKRAKAEPKKVVPIAIDIESTGGEPHCKVISVGLAMVWPDGKVDKQLIKMTRPRMPRTAMGEVIAPIPVLKSDDPGTIAYDPKTKWPMWTGKYINDKAEMPIVDYGDFEPRCWNEFWSKNIDTLIANVDWDPVFTGTTDPVKECALNDIDQWYGIRMTIDIWCVQVLEAGMKPRIVSDNPAFDIGMCNAEMMAAQKHCINPSDRWTTRKWGHAGVYYTSSPGATRPTPTLHYIPKSVVPTGDDEPCRRTVEYGYSSINDIEQFETASKWGKWIPEEPPLVESAHTHLASDDALNIASRYAAYAAIYPALA